MKTIHIMLQGKGGVGKSTSSVYLAEYLLSKNQHVNCIDTDQTNKTLSSFKKLNAQHISLLEVDKINERGFDDMIEMIIKSKSSFVIDNGASSFIPLISYMIDNHVIEFLKQKSFNVVIHTVVTGGQAMLDTLQGFKDMSTKLNQAKYVIWKNEYFGKVEMDGKQLEDTKAFAEKKDLIIGVVNLKSKNIDTFGKDLELMLSLNLTFDEAMKSDAFTIMSKQRLALTQQDIFAQLEAINFTND